ncbi:hypothetical protein NW768_011211 [Fusarium equiseti]|uniref:Uncharacterized protein n=1 Tax=Fusarium equiseti TaxID=61235 RepID=A0ABQ8QY50_FUSEQ|nr:hypothetical protein NW768_011211 [Fusarium equiseti]
MDFFTTVVDNVHKINTAMFDVVHYIFGPAPPAQIKTATLHFQDFAREKPCNVQASGLTPCVRQCEQACKVTFEFDDPYCAELLSTVIWRGTCYQNFRNGKLRHKFRVKGCSDYEVYWGTRGLPAGDGYRRHLFLKNKAQGKKGYGDTCTFDVEYCHRRIARLKDKSKSCKSSNGSCAATSVTCKGARKIRRGS